MQTTKIISQGNTKGVVLADGSVMLQRQGCTATVNACINGAYVEVRGVNGGSFSCDVSFTDGVHGPRHYRQGRYGFNPQEVQSEATFPAELTDDVLNFIELHSGKRPAKVRQQIHAYMFGWQANPCQLDDIILSPFRYDRESGAIVFVEGDVIVASLKSTESGDQVLAFNISSVEIGNVGEYCAAALTRALRVGFHQCDTAKGAEYCMKRLAWLAGCFYEEDRPGLETTVYVLMHDMETAATLVD